MEKERKERGELGTRSKVEEKLTELKD